MDELVNGVTSAACNAVLGKVDAAVGYYYAYSLVRLFFSILLLITDRVSISSTNTF